MTRRESNSNDKKGIQLKWQEGTPTQMARRESNSSDKKGIQLKWQEGNPGRKDLSS